MNKIFALSEELKKLNFLNEKFILSYCLAKIASEQLDLFPLEDIKYNCIKCKKIKSHEDIEFIDDLSKLICSDITPKFEINNPLCMECVEDYLYLVICALCGREKIKDDVLEIDYNTLHKVDVEDYIKYKLPKKGLYPVCFDCYYDKITFICDDCKESFLLNEIFYNGDDKICEKCSSKYEICSECNGNINMEEDLFNSINSELFCENCFPENINNQDELSEKIKEMVDDKSLFKPNNYVPLLKGTIKIIYDRLKSIEKKYSDRDVASPKISASFKNFIINTKLITKEEKDIIMRLLFKDDDLKIKEVITIIHYYEDLKKFDEALASEYLPVENLRVVKSLNFADVDFIVGHPNNNELYLSFIIIMCPSKRMMKAAREIFGETAGEVSWEIMSGYAGIHYEGSIAFARISNHNSDWVIDNFQRDSDLNNFEKNYLRYQETFNITKDTMDTVKIAAKWWDNQFKSWASQMLLGIQSLARKSGVRLYMTPFKIQEDKWPNIPRKNKDIYDRIPEELGRMSNEAQKDIPQEHRNVFPRIEEIRGKTEGGSGYDFSYSRLWRIAKRKKELIKIKFS